MAVEDIPSSRPSISKTSSVASNCMLWPATESELTVSNDDFEEVTSRTAEEEMIPSPCSVH